jgi:tetratricopeptide (TPR) repeat protein
MAPSNNKVADGLLASAHDSAGHDGLRLAVPRFLEAVEALVVEGRKEDAANVLAELLAAKEKKRGFLFGKRDDNPLGPERPMIAKRYAQLSRDAAPTETSLDTLNRIALQYPDDPDVRLSNADALKIAGYLLDALDEYKYCLTLLPDDVDLIVRLGELYSQLGRPDEAAAHARAAMAALGKSRNAAGVASVAARMLEFAPTAFAVSFDGFASLSGEVLAENRAQFDVAVAAFVSSDIQEPAVRSPIVARIGECFEKLIARAPSDQSLWQAFGAVDAGAAAQLRKIVEQSAVMAASPSPSAGAPPAVMLPPSSSPVLETVTGPEPPRRAPAAAGLSAFAKRKAMELFANSEYQAASMQLERVVKMSPDVEALEMLLECYLALDRHDEAARIGVRLADAELAAGNRPGAIATLTTLSKKIANPAVEQRRVDLMKNPQS